MALVLDFLRRLQDSPDPEGGSAMEWRERPEGVRSLERGFYLRKRATDGDIEIIEVYPSMRRMDYDRMGTEGGFAPDGGDRFLGPFTLAELEAWLLGRKA